MGSELVAFILRTQSAKVRQVESLWLFYKQLFSDNPAKLYAVLRSRQRDTTIDPVLNQKLLSELIDGKNILPILENWLDLARGIRLALQNRERLRYSLIVRWALFSILLWSVSLWFWISTDYWAVWIRQFVINSITGQVFCAIVGMLWWQLAPASQLWHRSFTPKALNILRLQASDPKSNSTLEIGRALLDRESRLYQAYMDWAPLWEIVALGGMAILVLGFPSVRHFGF